MAAETPPPIDRVLDAVRRWRDDLIAASLFLTRLPLARLGSPDTGLLARSMAAFPLVGIGVGIIGWIAFALADALHLPAAVAALVALTATILVTGALHEDGLADTADGFGGGSDTLKKLAIMRDSRTGAYGVIALVLSIALRGAALASLTASVGGALIAAHAVSRAVIPVLMRRLDPARSDGLGASAGQPDDAAIVWCLVIAAATALLGLDFWRGLAALLAVTIACGLFAMLARRQIGGYTGDVLGAAQQIGEIVMLLSAAAA